MPFIRGEQFGYPFTTTSGTVTTTSGTGVWSAEGASLILGTSKDIGFIDIATGTQFRGLFSVPDISSLFGAPSAIPFLGVFNDYQGLSQLGHVADPSTGIQCAVTMQPPLFGGPRARLSAEWNGGDDGTFVDTVSGTASVYTQVGGTKDVAVYVTNAGSANSRFVLNPDTSDELGFYTKPQGSGETGLAAKIGEASEWGFKVDVANSQCFIGCPNSSGSIVLNGGLSYPSSTFLALTNSALVMSGTSTRIYGGTGDLEFGSQGSIYFYVPSLAAAANFAIGPGQVIVNTDQQDVDFMVASDNLPVVLMTNGGSDKVQIGSATDLGYGQRLEVNGKSYFTDHIAMGTGAAVSATEAFNVKKAWTSSTGSQYYGVRSEQSWTAATVGETSYKFNGYFYSSTTGSNNFGRGCSAVDVLCGHAGTGTSTNYTAINANVFKGSTGGVGGSLVCFGGRFDNQNATGSVSSAYGLNIANPTTTGAITTTYGAYIGNMAGTGNVTHAYGLDIATQSGAATTNMALRVQGGNIVFNENATSSIFRVESASNANMLYVDGANNRIGVGKTPAAGDLDVNGTILADSSTPLNRVRFALMDQSWISPASGSATVSQVDGTHFSYYKGTFADGSDQSLCHKIILPSSFVGSTVKFGIKGASSSTTGTADIRVSYLSLSDGSTPDIAAGYPVDISWVPFSGAGGAIATAFSSAVTFSGTSGDSVVQFKITRQGSTDSLGADFDFHGLLFEEQL